MHLRAAIQAFHEQAYGLAAEHAAAAAAAAPTSRVAAAAATYLQRVVAEGPANVYVTGTAFAAFIRGGGNVPLYAQTSAALQAIYADYQQLALLDIGVGDGLALLPALTAQVQRLDLVEPSAAMLAQTSAALTARSIAHTAHATTLQAFMAQPQGRWDLAQATFSLQSLPPADRAAAFTWLHAHVEHLVLVEFDVPPATTQLDPDWIAHVLACYERGLAEYADDGDLVAQGFLMPVLFGYFAAGAVRTNYEQPIDHWEAELSVAGFGSIQRQPIYDYWWAPAVLLRATATRSTP
jgi:hypothetical protein